MFGLERPLKRHHWFVENMKNLACNIYCFALFHKPTTAVFYLEFRKALSTKKDLSQVMILTYYTPVRSIFVSTDIYLEHARDKDPGLGEF